MATLVFLLSRCLPGLYTPKGMLDADSNLYGQASSAATIKVKEEYLQRHGLHLPTFYFSIDLQGEKKAGLLNASSLDKEWLKKAVLWHGVSPAQQFYLAWLQWQKTIDSTQTISAREQLLRWSRSNNQLERQRSAVRFEAVFLKGAPKQEKGLAFAWHRLSKNASPWYYYLPTMNWHGLKNQYHQWFSQLLSGDLGYSRNDYSPVSEKIKEALVPSAILAFTSLSISTLAAYFLGMGMAQHHGGYLGKFTRQIFYGIESVPGFLLALILLYIYLAFGGSLSTHIDFYSNSSLSGALSLFSQSSFLLSVFCVVLFLLPFLTIQFYQSLNNEVSSLYLRTARAKGLSFQQALRRHAFGNALSPSLAILSEMFVGLMAGVLVVEVTFSVPGIGSLLTQSILSADYPVLIGITLFLLIFRITVVGITDILQASIDPRVQLL